MLTVQSIGLMLLKAGLNIGQSIWFIFVYGFWDSGVNFTKWLQIPFLGTEACNSSRADWSSEGHEFCFCQLCDFWMTPALWISSVFWNEFLLYILEVWMGFSNLKSIGNKLFFYSRRVDKTWLAVWNIFCRSISKPPSSPRSLSLSSRFYLSFHQLEYVLNAAKVLIVIMLFHAVDFSCFPEMKTSFKGLNMHFLLEETRKCKSFVAQWMMGRCSLVTKSYQTCIGLNLL